jgi:hypothetical protein
VSAADWRSVGRGLGLGALAVRGGSPLWLAAGLALGGCAGDGGTAQSQTRSARPGELPVICVAGAGVSKCPPGSGRWYYDYPSNRCLTTSPGACPGRRLFDSPESCRKQCGAAP